MTHSAFVPPAGQAILIAHARAAAARAYAPYSGFHVGAALLMADGSIITGANVENASYGLTLCAETVAIARAANEGRLAEVRAVAIIGGRPAGGEAPDRSDGAGNRPVAAAPPGPRDAAPALMGTQPVAPCGRCRQMLNEAAQLGGHDLIVTCVSGDGRAVVSHPLSALLPMAFGPADLGLAPCAPATADPPAPADPQAIPAPPALSKGR